MIVDKNYPGHKSINGDFQKIINEIPKCDVFCELFAGSSAVYSKMTTPPGLVVLNDKSIAVCDWLEMNRPAGVVTNTCYRSCLDNLIEWIPETVVVFADPPYLHETRPNNTELYEHEFTPGDHVAFLGYMRSSPFMCIIIHPECELYNETLRDWRSVPVKIRYHRKTSHERIWMNFDIPKQLQDISYVGDNRTKRQGLKRKLSRLLLKLEALPPSEQQFIITALQGRE